MEGARRHLASYSSFSGSSSSHPKHWSPDTLQVGCTVLTWHQQRITARSWWRETTAMWSLLMEVEALFCISIMAAYVVDAFIIFFQMVCFMQSEMESWFVQLGGASPLLARTGWPVPGWRDTTDLHETQHTINGHLLWITHSKMSPRLLAATDFFVVFFLSQPREWGDAGSLLESPRSSTRACIIHGLATRRALRKRRQEKQENYGLWKGWLWVWDLRNSLLKVVFWSGSPALQSVPGPSM